MYKIILILFLIILFTECSVIRNRESRNYEIVGAIYNGKEIENVKKRNLSSKSFFIQKAEIEILSPEGTERILASIKFEFPNKYLISIKSRSGIEAVRIFISDDTILVNDRINRRLYCGSAQYLKFKYGISTAALPVILGDYIDDEVSDAGLEGCSEGKLAIDGIVTGLKIKYVIDCEKGKTILAVPENGLNDGEIAIKFEDFISVNGIQIPGRVKINYLRRKASIEINIQKIEVPWTGNIEFIPGSRYEILQLL